MILEVPACWVKKKDGVCEVTYSLEKRNDFSPENYYGKLIVNATINTGEELVINGFVPTAKGPIDILKNWEYQKTVHNWNSSFVILGKESLDKVLDSLFVPSKNWGYEPSRSRFILSDVSEYWWIELDKYLVKGENTEIQQNLIIASNFIVKDIKCMRV